MQLQKTVCFLLLLLLFANESNAQNHYWAQQYGAENTLLSGAVIAGVRDNSAMYYNPGALGFIDVPKISVSATAYGVDLINLKNGAGTNLDLRSNKLVIYPQIASGSLSINKNPKFKMVYGTMIRYRTALHFEQQNTGNYDVFKGLPGDEFYDAHVEYDFNSTGNWVGGAFAYRINEHCSIGYTQFFSYLNLQYRQSLNVTSDNRLRNIYFVSANNSNLNFTINNINAIEKIGFAYQKKIKNRDSLYFKFGLTVTMPSLKIWSKSKVYQSLELNNIGDGTISSLDSINSVSSILNNSNSNIKTNYKEAASVGIGMEFEGKKFRMCLAAEYFIAVKEYNLIKDNSLTVKRPVVNNSPEYITDFMTVRQSNNHIVNIAIGAEYKFRDRIKKNQRTVAWSLIAGARTDFNNHDIRYKKVKEEKGSQEAFNPDNWRYVHFSLGASFDRKTDKLSFGVDYGLGITNRTLQAVNISEPDAQNFLLGIKQNTVIPKIHSISLVMGYTYKFNKTDKIMKMRPL
ncbi:MAG: hypothetical protein U0U67_07615 [Chitinophagales bacterium]